MLQTDGEFLIDNRLVELLQKGKLDHSEFDKSYFLRKMQNEAKMVEQKTELREAKSQLRDFERNLDDEMPKLERLG